MCTLFHYPHHTVSFHRNSSMSFHHQQTNETKIKIKQFAGDTKTLLRKLISQAQKCAITAEYKRNWVQMHKPAIGTEC